MTAVVCLYLAAGTILGAAAALELLDRLAADRPLGSAFGSPATDYLAAGFTLAGVTITWGVLAPFWLLGRTVALIPRRRP